MRLEPLDRIIHSSGDAPYARLNDAVCVLAAEGPERVIRLEVAEAVLEPLAE